MGSFKAWLKDTALRTVKTWAQGTMGALVIDKVTPMHSNFEQAAEVGVAAAAVCVLMALSNLGNAPVQVVTVVPSGQVPVVSDLNDAGNVGEVPPPEDDTDVVRTDAHPEGH
jgi:hypothetical protein